MPGTGGFMGKLWLLTSAVEGGRLGLLVVAALNSVLSLAYYWKIIRVSFIHTDYGLDPVSVPFASYIVLAVSVAGILLIGVYPNLVLGWAETAIQAFHFPGT
jgi:NADH-quinone oxidoreductase subunit N